MCTGRGSPRVTRVLLSWGTFGVLSWYLWDITGTQEEIWRHSTDFIGVLRGTQGYSKTLKRTRTQCRSLALSGKRDGYYRQTYARADTHTHTHAHTNTHDTHTPRGIVAAFSVPVRRCVCVCARVRLQTGLSGHSRGTAATGGSYSSAATTRTRLRWSSVVRPSVLQA
jgi:hypothetical protein